MNVSKTSTIAWCVGTLAVVAAGCQSSGIGQRKAEREAAYQSLNAGSRKLVDKGKIRDGMDTNAVYMAWGLPTDAFTLDVPGQQRLIWNYEEKWTYGRSRIVPAGSSGGRPRYSMESWRVPITYVAKSATFENGKIIQWKKYDPPVFDQPPEKPGNSPYAF
jgi:hypothetical protein